MQVQRAVLTLSLLSLFFVAPVRADVVTEWNEIAVNANLAAGANSLAQSRAMSIVHAAIYDAVNAIDRRHAIYSVDVKANPKASLEAAAASAAYGVLLKMYWAQAPVFEAALERSLAAIPDGQAKSDGMAVGKEVAEKIFALRSQDGVNASVSYTPSSPAPGVYQLTPPANAAPLTPHWGAIKPFLLTAANQFELAGPTPVASAAFAKDFNEVKSVGAKNSRTRTQDQTDVARFWTISGIVMDNSAARQVAVQKNFSIADNARLFALLNMAGADAYIACWQAKYRYNYWRPVTAIRNAEGAGNSAIAGEANWEPLLPTPAHPEYPSGHAIYAGATDRVLQEFFGDKATFTLTNPALKLTRTYQSFSQLGQEVVDARVWGGIHYRTTDEHAFELGHKIAEYGIKNYMRPIAK